MHPLAHGYTNHTMGDTTNVVKTYQGPDADLRQAREERCYSQLIGRLPVPEIRASVPGSLTLSFLPGAHGQDLIDAGHAAQVLRSCGRLLRTLHDIDIVTGLDDPEHPGPERRGPERTVVVHGDFGPNNILLDPRSFAVTGLLDWEFAHVGEPVEDLAWCEWIVRAHHSTHRAALAEFFDAYGAGVPAWTDRQAAMIARCLELREFCRRWDPQGPAVQVWTGRAEAVAGWRE
ncbi:phosphotransferase [Actinospica durhamensis]|uniref:Phosphotransferase n=1 Tax=Actinospica durhamensis TaxID=1508375 RepID=A0A941EPF2_9ACTN|nr:phosphotransferase [Actinospica durhamensis]MBR7834756.1 phosphotransferase [Actinospica durhamensis]